MTYKITTTKTADICTCVRGANNRKTISVLKSNVFSGLAALAILAALSWSTTVQAETVNIPVPKAVVSAAFNAALSSVSVNLDNYGSKHGTSWHEDSSYVLLPGGSQKNFSIPEQTFKVTKWRKLRHYIDDMRTSNIQASVNGGRIDVSVFFENQGEEVKGRCIRRRLGKWKECSLPLERDIHLNNAQILASLTPVAYKGTISFANASARFTTDIKIASKLCQAFSGICGWIESKIKNELTGQIEGQFNNQLNTSAVKTAVANSIRNNAAYKAIINPSWQVTKVASSGSNFIITVTRPDVINASSVKSLKMVAVPKKLTRSCPTTVKFSATIKTKHAVKGKFWLKYENGKTSGQHNWSAGKNKTITSNVSRNFKGKAGKSKKGWSVLHIRYKGSNGQFYTRKSTKAKFTVKCTLSGASGLQL